MSNQNTHKPGYKHTPFGWIPEDWEVKELNKVMNLINGRAFKPSEWETKGLPIIRIQNLNDSEASFNYYNHKVENKYHIENGDILFAWSGTKGVSFGARIWKNGKAILNQHIFKVIPDCKLLTKPYSYLALQKMQSNIESKAHGFKSSFVHVKKFDLDKTLITIPPLIEQEKIITILSTWDEAISKTQQLIIKLQQRNKGLMQQLLTGKKRLKGFKGEVTFHHLRNFIFEVSEKNKDNIVTRVLSITNSRGFVNQAEQFDREVASENKTNYKIIRKNHFAYNPSRVNVGSLDLLTTFEDGILSPMYVVFKTDNKSLLPKFLYFQLKSDWFYGHIPMYVQGSVRDSLAFDSLTAMKFFIPSIKEQEAIVEILDEATREVNFNKHKLAALKQQKKGLMQKLLTGEIRVRV